MKLAKIIAIVILIVAALLVPAAPNIDVRRERKPVVSDTSGPPFLTPPCSDLITSIKDCPDTGCGEAGDAELNRAKNRMDAPSHVINTTLDDIRRLPQPQSWDTGAARTSIRGPRGEGAGVVVSGFLLKAKAEGKESCNCDLSHRVDTDVHLVLVSKLPDSETQEAFATAEADSVTVEITPRVRGQNEKWLYRNVNDLERSYIRVTGFLMLDTKHLPQGQFLPGERRNRSLNRSTNWEIHPITKLEVCTKSQQSCDNGSGWKKY